jgi:hypothetical protein
LPELIDLLDQRRVKEPKRRAQSRRAGDYDSPRRERVSKARFVRESSCGQAHAIGQNESAKERHQHVPESPGRQG